MGVTNFDYLPQNIVTTKLQEAKQVRREQKGSQKHVSGNNLRYYMMSNGPGMAWEGSISSSAPSAEFELVMVSDHAETILSDVCLELFTSSNGGSSWTRVENTGDYLAPEIVAFEIVGGNFVDNQTKWQISLFGSGYLGFRYQVLSTDSVTVSLTRIK